MIHSDKFRVSAWEYGDHIDLVCQERACIWEETFLEPTLAKLISVAEAHWNQMHVKKEEQE